MKNTIKYPSLEELEQYHNGTLTASRCHEIESLALEDPVMADALEGFERVPSFYALPPAADVFSDVAAPVSSARRTWFKWQLNGWLAGVITGATVIGGVIVWVVLSHSGKMTEHQQTAQKGSEEVASPSEIKENDSGVEEITDSTHISHKEAGRDAAISSAKEITGQSGKSDADEKDARTGQPDLSVSSSLIAASVTYVNGHKVLDYSDAYTSGFPDFTEVVLSGGTKYEGGESYLQFLKGCLDAYESGNFDEAEKAFQWLRETYPDDANATFFVPMCHYHLGRYSEAEEGFRHAMSVLVPTHKDNTRFHLALTLASLNSTEEAIQILEKLSAEGGKMSKEASLELQRLNKH
ncbi:MAG: tetratricopeptide repeat protein [Flavobacteriales bacterium]